MITGPQIRAARGLLGWSLEELSSASGITRNSISNAEGEKHELQESKRQKLMATFMRHGIEFLEDEGVRKQKGSIRTIKGADAYRQFLDQVYETMRKGGRTCQFASDATYLA